MISALTLRPLRKVWLGLLALAALSTPGLADQRVVTRFEMFAFARIGVLTLRNRLEESGGPLYGSPHSPTQGGPPGIFPPRPRARGPRPAPPGAGGPPARSHATRPQR